MPQTADFDHTLFEQGNNEGDKNLLVKFFNKPKENKAKSAEAGRPIFEDTCYVDIRVAGSRNGHVCRPATMRDKQRFPRHYSAFENRHEMPTEGTPLAEWPLMSRSQAEEFAFINVKTVEQLATMPDNNVQKFMGGFALKQKAVEWLEKAKEDATDAKFKEIAEQAQAENAELKGKLDEQASTLAEQNELIANLSKRLNALESQETNETEETPAKNKRRRRANTEE